MRRQLVQDIESEKAGIVGLKASYRKESNWRRLLHNELMALQGSVRVVCRVRPLQRTPDTTTQDIDDGHEPHVHRQRESKPPIDRIIEESAIFTDCQSPGVLAVINPRTGTKTTHLYDVTLGPEVANGDGNALFDPVRPLIISVLDGFNNSIFVFGETGSGMYDQILNIVGVVCF